MADADDDFGLPPVRAGSLLSDDELALLETLAGEHELQVDDLTEMIERERSVQGMGRRHGIHQWIKQHIAGIASRRLKDQA
jgi:hypothetical protein